MAAETVNLLAYKRIYYGRSRQKFLVPNCNGVKFGNPKMKPKRNVADVTARTCPVESRCAA